MKVQMEKVKSSAIEQMGYDSESKTLRVEWKRNGGIYDYEKVPFDVYVDLKHSASIGKSMQDIVKTYKSIKVGKEESK